MNEITLEHLEQAISNYRDTPENLRNQQMMAFLYESHWFPTLAVVEEARKVAQVEQNFNTHR